MHLSQYHASQLLRSSNSLVMFSCYPSGSLESPSRYLISSIITLCSCLSFFFRFSIAIVTLPYPHAFSSCFGSLCGLECTSACSRLYFAIHCCLFRFSTLSSMMVSATVRGQSIERVSTVS
ncbi:hypothetical protein JAAARDRAFT_465268 [Jaapia argillacea MUCL 33604]|uniref:Uncharacterized protein n=1 Tax=Jaapia argillacea MUCL 33604 TaxID=933084 RepID=A0A067Q6J6_9AGAM|nr:hypothetical protein JAAARDRAFT_465268 [Jaapia argillacea MUCL 33604]